MSSLAEQVVLTASRISLDARAAADLDKLLAEPVDWPDVLKLAIPHGTLPLLARNLRENAAEDIPASLLRQTNAHADRIQTRNQQAARELTDVLKSLRRAGIEAIPFKGPVLDATLYRGAGVREFADIDLMVRRDELAPATEAVRTLGYSLASRQIRQSVSALQRKDEALEFVRDDRLPIDLHCRFSNTGFEFSLDPESLRENLRTVRIGSLDVRVYDPESTLLILCAHQAKHRWRRLNWLCDIAAFLETYFTLDWSATLKRARQIRCERILLTTLELARILLGAKVPPVVAERIGRERKARRLAELLSPSLLTAPPAARSLYIRMRDGHPIIAASRYAASKVRHRLA